MSTIQKTNNNNLYMYILEGDILLLFPNMDPSPNIHTQF